MEGAAQQVQEAPSKLFATIGEFSLPGGAVFSPTYLQAGAVLVAIFIAILAFAMFQRRQHRESVKNTVPGIAFGFALALLLEAILLVGGRTVFTEVLGWENAPKPIANALDASRNHLVDVLGVAEEVPESVAAEPPTIGAFMQNYEGLEDSERESLQSLICPK